MIVSEGEVDTENAVIKIVAVEIEYPFSPSSNGLHVSIQFGIEGADGTTVKLGDFTMDKALWEEIKNKPIEVRG